jgi:alpha-ketoglutarate-dependent taurine dioxygenase
MSLNISPLCDALGVEVTGINLAASVSEHDVETLQATLADRLVMVIRDQSLDPTQLLAALRLFGETMPQHLSDMLMPGHPEIAVLDSRKAPKGLDGRVMPVGSRAWHTDHTNHTKPPKVTALYAVQLPKSSGDTSFANMQLAYARLPEAQRAELAGLRTVNKIEDHGYVNATDRQRFGNHQHHPLIRTHPETGKQGIYLHPGKTERIEGMEPDASRVFVDNLLDQTIGPNVTYRHQWHPGDLVLWDNRGVMHQAHADYDMQAGRVMHRVLLEGEIPR